jgi:hypothetical protein
MLKVAFKVTVTRKSYKMFCNGRSKVFVSLHATMAISEGYKSWEEVTHQACTVLQIKRSENILQN